MKENSALLQSDLWFGVGAYIHCAAFQRINLGSVFGESKLRDLASGILPGARIRRMLQCMHTELDARTAAQSCIVCVFLVRHHCPTTALDMAQSRC